MLPSSGIIRKCVAPSSSGTAYSYFTTPLRTYKCNELNAHAKTDEAMDRSSDLRKPMGKDANLGICSYTKFLGNVVMLV